MRKKLTVVAIALGIGFAGAGTASAVGGNCNGRVDANCNDHGNNCTVYVANAGGCQVGFTVNP